MYISDPVITKKTNAVPLIILIIPKMSAAILVDGLPDYWTSIAVSHGVHLAAGFGSSLDGRIRKFLIF